MLTWHEVGFYLRLLMRWWFVLAAAVLLSAGTAWYLLRDQPDFYVAQSSLQVGQNFSTNTPSSVAVDLSNVLASYYDVLMRREVILKPVSERLQLGFPWYIIRDSMLATSINRQANLLEIKITDSNPERAAAIANALSEQLIAYSPNSPEKIAAERNEIERQLSETQLLLDDVTQRIKDLEERQANLDSAIDIRDISDQLDRLETQRERYQTTYNELITLRSSSTSNSLSIFEPAAVPEQPLPKKTRIILGIAGLGGLMLAICAVLLLDRLDLRWRSGNDLQERLGLTNLGTISYGAPIALAGASAANTKRVRSLREAYTRLVLQARDSVPRVLLVSSPEPSELRSAFVIDLADVYARSGHRVLIVDAELTKPHISRMLLEDTLTPRGETVADKGGALELWDRPSSRAFNLPSELWMRLRRTPLTNVVLLPSQHPGNGELPVLVPSLHWPDIIQSLRESADVVIFNGPSLLTGADAAIIAPKVEGVVLVVNPATDTRAQIAESKARLLNHQDTHLLGTVIVTKDEEAGVPNQSQPKPAEPSRIGVTVDSGGITITLPSRRHTRRTGERQPAELTHTPSPSDAKADAARTVTPGASRTEAIPDWEELASRSTATERQHERYMGQRSSEPPPTPPLITPMVIITPHSESLDAGDGETECAGSPEGDTKALSAPERNGVTNGRYIARPRRPRRR